MIDLMSLRRSTPRKMEFDGRYRAYADCASGRVVAPEDVGREVERALAPRVDDGVIKGFGRGVREVPARATRVPRVRAARVAVAPLDALHDLARVA